MATSKLTGRGGPGRGQGRKRMPDGASYGVTLGLTPSQNAKLKRLGGAAWLREQIDAAVPGEKPERGPNRMGEDEERIGRYPAKVGALQAAKFKLLGGSAWLRALLDRAREPLASH